MKYLLVVILFISILSCKEKEVPKKPNFIFIMVDDLGKEWIESYGATEIKTPNINQLSATGITFNNAYSMPQCTPTRVALITGQYPYTNGWVNHYDVPRWGHGVNFDADKNPSFAKALQNAGYKTCVAGKWQINDFRIEPNAMRKAGFDEYCMWTGYESGNKPSDSRYWDPYIFTKDGSKTYKGEFGPDIFSDFIIDFAKKNKDAPMCIYYPMILTHSPFVHTPNEPNVTTKYEKHRAMVRYTDFIIGKITKALKELDIMDNTYLIFTTDNGTSPSIIGKRNAVYVRGGKAYLTENGINSPFLVLTPDKQNFETDALIDFTDIYPTLLDLAGVENNSQFKQDGYSFANVLKGEEQKSERDWILSMGGLPARINEKGYMENSHGFRNRVLRNNRYKVYVDSLQHIYRLYDMKNDAYETINLIENSELQEVVTYFKGVLDTEIPAKDSASKYTKTKGLPTDVDPAFLNKAVQRQKHRKNNMIGLATEAQFLKLSTKK